MEKLEEYIASHKTNKEKVSSFIEYLYSLMDKYGYEKAPDLYNKADISKQLWSSVISKKSSPSLNFCLKIVFALPANNHECKYLLKKAGFTLASSNDYSLIIRYGVANKLSIDEVNELLEDNGYADSLIH